MLIQLLIQRRITTISDQYLVKRDQLPVGDGDVEAAVEKKYQMDARTWPLLCLLLIGLLASVVGYVGVLALFRIWHRHQVLSVGSAWKLGSR